jgi:hypothetical protein
MGGICTFRRLLGHLIVMAPLAILACRPSPPAVPAAPVVVAATGPAPATGPVAPAPTSPAIALPTPRPLPILFAVARTGGTLVPLSPGVNSVAGPMAAFEIRAGAALPSARLVLLDAQDALVAGSGEVEVGSDTRFTFAPSEPLRAGGSYLLRLEGLTGPGIAGTDGAAYLPAAFPIQVPGHPGRPSGGRRR